MYYVQNINSRVSLAEIYVYIVNAHFHRQILVFLQPLIWYVYLNSKYSGHKDYFSFGRSYMYTKIYLFKFGRLDHKKCPEYITFIVDSYTICILKWCSSFPLIKCFHLEIKMIWCITFELCFVMNQVRKGRWYIFAFWYWSLLAEPFLSDVILLQMKASQPIVAQLSFQSWTVIG